MINFGNNNLLNGESKMTNETEIRYVGIDPSTKTGFVILSSTGEVLVEEEIRAKTTTDPLRMIDIVRQIKKQLRPTDKVVIEGFAYSAKGRGVDFQYGIGWMIRAMLYIEKIPYTDASPSQLKKFCCNRGNAKKEDLVLPMYKKWGYEHHSDNVRDAYVLARMAFSMYEHEKLNLALYEKEVLKKMTRPK